MLILRLAKVADLAEIVAFEEAVLPDAWTRASLQATFTSEFQQIWLLELKNEKPANDLAGLIHFTCVGDSSDILNLGLRENYRSQGLASLLLGALTAYAHGEIVWQNWQLANKISVYDIKLLNEAKSIRALNLEVREKNEKAINCYLKNDFQIKRKIKNFYTEPAFQKPKSWDYQGEAALCMQKKL